MSLLQEIIDKLDLLPEAQLKDLAKQRQATGPIWLPNPGPQTRAYQCEADELLYGGEAGGGKTDLLIGLALNKHKKSRILRRINQDAVELGSRLLDVIGSDEGFIRSPPTWHGGDGQMIEFRGCELEKDKQRFKGKARDFIGYDELADFLESQYVFINTWNRSVDPSLRCRIVGATNGPTTAEGMWIIKRWGAWLDPKHHNPAKDGELRWYLTVGDQDVEVDGPGPHEVRGKLVRATSRTFIRSRLEDNPDLAETDYGDRLEALPEDLRRVYRGGDFTVGMRDDDWQVIPTAWIIAAENRWTPTPPAGIPMTAIGVDPVQGGKDEMVIAPRHDWWFAEPIAIPGEQVPIEAAGSVSAAHIVRVRRDNAAVGVDCGGGYGGPVIERLAGNDISALPVKGSEGGVGRTKDRLHGFFNKRAEMIWRFREALDPDQPGGSPIALPPRPKLRADLAAARYEITPRGIKIEDKDEIKTRIGRSPDWGDAVVIAWALNQGNSLPWQQKKTIRGSRPTVIIGNAAVKARRRRF